MCVRCKVLVVWPRMSAGGIVAGRERPKPGDRELLLAARRGDRLAFGQLYRLYLPDVREYCARRIPDPTRAEDLAQDTFVRAFERIKEFRSDASFWPWISTIARHLCIDELRRRQRTAEEPTAEPPEPVYLHRPVDTTSEEAESRQANENIRHALGAALAQLSRRERSFLWRSAVQEQSWEQIARASGTTVDAARNAAWRARNTLKAIIGDSLHDIRTWIVVGLSRVAEEWRNLRRRGRSSVNAYLDTASIVLLETSAAVLIGIAALSFPLIPGIEDRVSQTPSLEATPNGQRNLSTSTATPTAPTERVSVRHAGPRSMGSVVGLAATMKSSHRPGSTAPTSTNISITIVGPGDHTIYWRETQIDCVDGRMSELPPSSPVRVVC